MRLQNHECLVSNNAYNGQHIAILLQNYILYNYIGNIRELFESFFILSFFFSTQSQESKHLLGLVGWASSHPIINLLNPIYWIKSVGDKNAIFKKWVGHVGVKHTVCKAIVVQHDKHCNCTRNNVQSVFLSDLGLNSIQNNCKYFAVLDEFVWHNGANGSHTFLQILPIWHSQI